ncbi:MAG: TolC family outer membrane protein [Legionella sp.]|nr:TolC family outer membrane protein [Legionella sp.]
MKKLGLLLFTTFLSTSGYSADLIEAFRQALQHDNIYQEAILNSLAQNEDVAINRASLLPIAQFDAQPLLDQASNSGVIVPNTLPPNNSIRSYEMRLSLAQPIFNFATFSRYKAAKISAQAAVAKLNADLQDLMLRVTDAYFKVLRSEKKLAYLRANQRALARQLMEVQQKFKAGKTTQNDIDIAQSSSSNAAAEYITAETELASAREQLAELTAQDYTQLADLRARLPLISPQPANPDRWVHKAVQGNWIIKGNQLKVRAARETVKQKYAAHLPTVNAKVLYDTNAFHYSQGSIILPSGSSRLKNAAAFLNINVPIFSGGLVVASTRKAQLRFRIAQQRLEHSLRQVKYQVRSSYRNVIANIKKIRYDEDAISSANSSLRGLRERYQAGSGNLTDVLLQQAKLLQVQMNYEAARYNYVLSLIRLKKEAGTLSTHDLFAVNQWLQKDQV